MIFINCAPSQTQNWSKKAKKNSHPTPLTKCRMRISTSPRKIFIEPGASFILKSSLYVFALSAALVLCGINLLPET